MGAVVYRKANAYAPFPMWVCLNGHEWAKRQAAQAGIDYCALDNGFAACDDAALGAICGSLGHADVQAFFAASGRCGGGAIEVAWRRARAPPARPGRTRPPTAKESPLRTPPSVKRAGASKPHGCARKFFAELGEQRSQAIEAVSLDMGPGYAKATREHAPQATRCIDSFHVAKLGSEALDEIRCAYWNELRSLDDRDAARNFTDARWRCSNARRTSPTAKPETLTALKAGGEKVARGYELTEALRGIFAPGPSKDDVAELLTRFCSRASRSRLQPFVRVAKTIRRHREGILAAIRLGNSAGVEALNNRVRLIHRRAYGFHSAQAALALIMLTCGPIELHLPPRTSPTPMTRQPEIALDENSFRHSRPRLNS